MIEEAIPEHIMGQLIADQQNEIDAHTIYTRVAKRVKDEKNRKIIESIAEDELAHYELLRQYSGKDLKVNRFKVAFFSFISLVFGITFGLKLLEKDEDKAVQLDYIGLDQYIPGISGIIEQEERHEKELLGMIDERLLTYIGSIVLGLNDALVELTGTLAGLSFAFQDTRLIALSGLITGIAASFSMAASEYLSTKTEGGAHALTSSIYTGLAYIVTVMLLILPFLILENYLICLAVTLCVSVLIILIFNYYISVAKDYDFKRRFLEMTFISLGVAAFSFGIGVLVKMLFGIEI